MNGINVLSLFDGMSCGQIALERAGIKVNKYYASEIDKYAIKVTQSNYPNTIQLGDVTKLSNSDFPEIDLLIGGSPCKDFSFAGKRSGMSTKDNVEILNLDHYLKLKNDGFEFEGQSYLFWEYMRLLNEVKPKYFLLENVKMSKKWENVLSDAIGVEPIFINSSLVSAQNRKRFYWTNIPNVDQPDDKNISLIDVLDLDLQDCKVGVAVRKKSKCVRVGGRNSQFNSKQEWDSPYQIVSKKCKIKPRTKKSGCLTGGANSGGNHSDMDILHTPYATRRYTTIECERLQTLPEKYTSCVSNSQRFKMIGNGWTVDVIAHIFKELGEDNE